MAQQCVASLPQAAGDEGLVERLPWRSNRHKVDELVLAREDACSPY
jgi:hypothetical protein